MDERLGVVLEIMEARDRARARQEALTVAGLGALAWLSFGRLGWWAFL